MDIDQVNAAKQEIPHPQPRSDAGSNDPTLHMTFQGWGFRVVIPCLWWPVGVKHADRDPSFICTPGLDESNTRCAGDFWGLAIQIGYYLHCWRVLTPRARQGIQLWQPGCDAGSNGVDSIDDLKRLKLWSLACRCQWTRNIQTEMHHSLYPFQVSTNRTLFALEKFQG